MARYIDAEQFLKSMIAKFKCVPLLGVNKYIYGEECFEGEPLDALISEIPTANVAEVKRGYNATAMHPVDEFVCSACGFACEGFTEIVTDEDGGYQYQRECEFDYCPKCGAKMDGRSDT